jgi:hypothetical protein
VRIGCRMSDQVRASGGAGAAEAWETYLSPRARAVRYADMAAEIKELAGSKPAGAIRVQLLTLSRQYELLARNIDRVEAGAPMRGERAA